MYLTFEQYSSLHDDKDYSDTFESTYPILEREVEAKINQRTYNRFKNDTTYPDELLNCVSAMIDLLNTKRTLLESDSDSNSPSVASQSNDGVSITYRQMSADNLLTTLDKELNRTMEMYLYGVRNSEDYLVLYKGIYPNE